jgi:DNA-binding IclR family transcriptional regulator
MVQEKKPQGSAPRILNLLRCIAENPGEITLKDLAARLSLPQSTAHRLLQHLVAADMVVQSETQAYRPGPEFFRIASLALARIDLPKLAHPFLLKLWNQWQETCVFCLYKPASRTAVVADLVATPHPLRFVIEAHTELSIAWGSLGRSILAFLPQTDVDAVLADTHTGPLSGRPLPSRGEMLTELAVIRDRGCAVFEDRRPLDVAGVAAPVFGADRTVIGCIGTTMPASRFDTQDRDALCAAVTDYARTLSAQIGYRP